MTETNIKQLLSFTEACLADGISELAHNKLVEFKNSMPCCDGQECLATILNSLEIINGRYYSPEFCCQYKD